MILERFGVYVFPVYSVGDTLGPAARADIYSTPGGGFDPNGKERANGIPKPIIRRCEIVEWTPAELQVELDAGRALLGLRDKIYARTGGLGEVRWLWGRLASVDIERGGVNFAHQALVYTFHCAAHDWNGRGYADWTLDDGHFLDTGYYLDTGNIEGNLVSTPDSFTFTNGGNRTVTNVIIAVIAGSAAITSVTLRLGDAELVWTGTLAAGTQLLIDSGSYRVTNNGANAYSGLSLGANHTIDDWLRIAPGSNALTFTWAGGGTGSRFTLNFWDGWY